MRKGAAIGASLLLLALCLLLPLGCARQQGVLNPAVTLPPLAESPEPSAPTPAPTLAPQSSPGAELPQPAPATGAEGEDYWEYLLFKDLLVYEHNGDTMVDGVIVSSYPGTLVGVLEITWSDREGMVAVGRFTDGWGQEVLYLTQGENRVYARADTDMPVTDLPFVITAFGDPLTALD